MSLHLGSTGDIPVIDAPIAHVSSIDIDGEENNIATDAVDNTDIVDNVAMTNTPTRKRKRKRRHAADKNTKHVHVAAAGRHGAASVARVKPAQALAYSIVSPIARWYGSMPKRMRVMVTGSIVTLLAAACIVPVTMNVNYSVNSDISRPAAIGASSRQISGRGGAYVDEVSAASRDSVRESLDINGDGVVNEEDAKLVYVSAVTGKYTTTNDKYDIAAMNGDKHEAEQQDLENKRREEENKNRDVTLTDKSIGATVRSGVSGESLTNTDQIKMDEHPLPVSSGDTGNQYPWGQCTWYAYARRHQLGLPAASYFGNGGQWAASARSLGYSVDNLPKVGDIAVFYPGQHGADGYYGHVAIVEAVHADGSVTISESNVAGLGVISSRVIPADPSMQYIH